MSRPLRLEFEGAVYHVTSRGNERAAIFRDDADREKFLEIVASIVDRQRWLLHAYCLMGNHYHLLVETPRGNLSSGMQRLNGRYTQLFNRRHRRAGHVLEGRYKAIHVEKEAHLLELCRYVVLNPVRARLVERPEDWRWSSYRMTAGRTGLPKWLEVEWTLSRFGRKRSLACTAYRNFVAEGRGARSPLLDVTRQVFLGGESFLDEMDSRLKGHRWGEDIPAPQKTPSWTGLNAICKAVAAEFGVAESALSRKRGGDDKMAAIYLAWRLTGKTGAEIGEAFGIKPARVSNIVSEVDGGRRPALARRLRRLAKEMEAIS